MYFNVNQFQPTHVIGSLPESLLVFYIGDSLIEPFKLPLML